MLSSPQRYTVEIQHSMTFKDVFVPNVHIYIIWIPYAWMRPVALHALQEIIFVYVVAWPTCTPGDYYDHRWIAHRQAIFFVVMEIYSASIIVQEGASIIHVKGRLLVILTAKVYAYN